MAVDLDTQPRRHSMADPVAAVAVVAAVWEAEQRMEPIHNLLETEGKRMELELHHTTESGEEELHSPFASW